MPLSLIGAIAGPILGGVLGDLFGSADKDAAEQLMKDALAEIESVGAPPDLSREIILKKFTQAGLYTPELESAIDLGVSKVSQIQEDPSLRKAQTGALELLQQRGKGGLSPEDRAALNSVRGEVQRDSQAKQGQILQSMQARGLGGGGAELMASLQAAQAGDDRASAEGDRIGAMASQNALQAIMQGGQMAGGIRSQDFGVNQARSAAEDEINRFNVQNAVSRQSRNIGSKNVAEQQNLAGAQRAQDANVTQGNAELYRQAQAKQDYWNNQMRQAQAKAQAQQAQANNLSGQAAQTAQQWQSVGSGVGAAAGAMAGKTATPATGGYTPGAATDEANRIAREKEEADKAQRWNGAVQ